jgi:hypothetical protein
MPGWLIVFKGSVQCKQQPHSMHPACRHLCRDLPLVPPCGQVTIEDELRVLITDIRKVLPKSLHDAQQQKQSVAPAV